MWTRLFRPGAQSTRSDHDLDHETSPTHTKRLFIAASAFFFDLSSSSVLKISLILSFSPPLSHPLRSLLYPAPPKPSLDQERLQLIALSCIRHPGHTRGAYSCAATRGTLQRIVAQCKTGARPPLFCLGGRWSNIIVIPAGREVCTYNKKISLVYRVDIVWDYNIGTRLGNDWVEHQVNNV
jgi:hypothetical protein